MTQKKKSTKKKETEKKKSALRIHKGWEVVFVLFSISLMAISFYYSFFFFSPLSRLVPGQGGNREANKLKAMAICFFTPFGWGGGR
jgi:hypothetical protein